MFDIMMEMAEIGMSLVAEWDNLLSETAERFHKIGEVRRSDGLTILLLKMGAS
jgi:hypothetical protein